MIGSEQEVWTWIPVKERSQTNKPTGQPSSLLYGLIHLPVMCSQPNSTRLNYFSLFFLPLCVLYESWMIELQF